VVRRVMPVDRRVTRAECLEGGWRPSVASTGQPGSKPPRAMRRSRQCCPGSRRTIGAAAVRKKAATSDIVLGMVGGKGTSLRELRDRAILLLGFSGAFRRSELVALNLGKL
jgi:hypothetical protein